MNNSNQHFKIPKDFTIKLIIILLLLIIFICILIKVTVNISHDSIHNNSNAIVLLKKDTDADKIGNKLNDNITKVFKYHNTSNFSISTWIYIENWDFGLNKYKIILEERDISDSNKLNMIIALDKKNNNLIFGIKVNNLNNSDEYLMKYYIYENILTQKWVNITYVIKNTMFDLYIDGDLKQRNQFHENVYHSPDFASDTDLTSVSPNYVKNITYKLIDSSNKKIALLPFYRDKLDENTDSDTYGNFGFKGKIAKLYYFATDISSSKAKEIYEAGPY
jgi:hypothetical protein